MEELVHHIALKRVISMDSELAGAAMFFLCVGPVAFNIPHFNSIPLIDFWIFLVSSLGRSGKIAPEKIEFKRLQPEHVRGLPNLTDLQKSPGYKK